MDLGAECLREARLLRDSKIVIQQKVQVQLASYKLILNEIKVHNSILNEYKENIKFLCDELDSLNRHKLYRFIPSKQRHRNMLQQEWLEVNNLILDEKQINEHNLESMNSILDELKRLYDILSSRIAYGQRLEKAARDNGESLSKISNKEVEEFRKDLYNKYLKTLDDIYYEIIGEERIIK